MFIRLLILFTLVPVGELALLIEIGRRIGVWPTIAIILATGVAGSLLLKWQGFETWRRFKSELSEGRFPGNTIIDGVAIILGGAFLLTPGVITDCCGILLLIPPTRALFIKLIKRYLKWKFNIAELSDIIDSDDRSSRDGDPLDPTMRVD